jgi:hypothetical protein
MKIANAADLTIPAIQQSAGASLAAGEAVTTPLVTTQDAAKLLAQLSSPAMDELLRRYRSELAETHVATLHPTAVAAIGGALPLTAAQQAVFGTTAGAGFGALTGAGAAMVLETIRAVAPKSAAVLTLGASLIGAGVGGLFGSRVLSQLSVDKHGVAMTGAVSAG